MINLPEAGEWSWTIEAFTMVQPQPELTVLNGTGVAAASTEIEPASSTQAKVLPILAGVLGLILAITGFVAVLANKPRWALPVLVAGLLIAVAGFYFARVEGPAQAAQPEPELKVESALYMEGQALFVSKGCVTCHTIGDLPKGYQTQFIDGGKFGGDIGPKIEKGKYTREYLELWMKDPSSVKPKTEMPQLELNKTEIQALAEFILGDPSGNP